MKRIIKFKFEKELKHCYRYLENNESGLIILKTIYVQKWAVEGKPEELTVTIQAD